MSVHVQQHTGLLLLELDYRLALHSLLGGRRGSGGRERGVRSLDLPQPGQARQGAKTADDQSLLSVQVPADMVVAMLKREHGEEGELPEEEKAEEQDNEGGNDLSLIST